MMHSESYSMYVNVQNVDSAMKNQITKWKGGIVIWHLVPNKENKYSFQFQNKFTFQLWTGYFSCKTAQKNNPDSDDSYE